MYSTVWPSRDTRFLLPRAIPSSWTCKAVRVVRLTSDSTAGKVNFRFSDIEVYSPTTDIVHFIRDLHGSGAPPPNTTVPPLTPQVHPLEIRVAERCYVVVMLPRGGPVRFRAGGPAITAKEDYGDDNCGLGHVHKEFRPLSDRAPGEGCYFAYFAVFQRGAFERQSFNFHLELEQDNNRGWLEIAIDPDVPDDGGGIPR